MAKYVGPVPPRLPDPGLVDFSNPDKVREFHINLVASITQHFIMRPTQTTPRAAQMFEAPDGSIYTMSVDNAGAPVFTLTNKKTDLPP